MKKVMVDESIPNRLNTSVTKQIFDDGFIDEIKTMKMILDPICKLTNVCQNMRTSIADACNLWLNFKWDHSLFSLIQPTLNKKLIQCLFERKKKALNTFTLTSYFLHPHYDNDLLSDAHQSVIKQFLLVSLNEEGLASLCQFKNKKNLFHTLYEKGLKDAEVFWGTASMEKSHVEISTLALKLLNIPASTAQLERTFSNWGWIHTGIRNRLTFDRSKKLIHVYISLNQQTQRQQPFLDDL